MVDVDAFLDGYSGPVEEVPICGNPGLIAEHAKLESEVFADIAAAGMQGPPADKVEALRALEAQIDESVVVFKLRALGYQAWTDLKGQHPPVDEGLIVNVETFEPAGVAACAIDPPLTVEQATRMRETLPPSEWQALVKAMWGLHGGGQASPPKSLLLSGLRPVNDDSSDSPLSVESPEAGSLADHGEQSPNTDTTPAAD